jgi:hypothetical protein
MPPVIKKSCVNNTEFSYSGKECSPLGKGYAADAEQVGTIMEGRDSTMWMVGIKNGVKVWNRVPTDLANDIAVVGDLQKPSGPSEAKAPTAAAKKKAAAAAKKAVKKEPVSLVSESEDEPDKSATTPLSDIKEESSPAPETAEPVKEKKKAAATKKKAEAAAPKIVVVAEEDVEITEEKAEVKAEEKAEEKAEAPKKKVTKKKVVTEPEGAEEKAEIAPAVKEKAAAPKATRAPTDFNLFMKYQLEVLGKENPEMKHKDKFSKAAAQWKELGEDEKKAILVKAKAA